MKDKSKVMKTYRDVWDKLQFIGLSCFTSTIDFLCRSNTLKLLRTHEKGHYERV